jgi:hypothetical protein
VTTVNVNDFPAWLQEAQKHSTTTWGVTILPLSSLRPMRIDEAERGYQRPINQPRVDDLTDKFDGGEAREIYVSRRADGSCWILDGQHTWAALIAKGITEWQCRVFFNLSIAEEAHRFAQYQSNTRRIPPVVQFNAEVIAGDVTAQALDTILGDFYLRISSSKLRYQDGYLGVTARSVFQRIYELGGSYLLSEVLQLAIDAWGQNKNALMGRVLQGLGYLFAHAEGEFDRERMLAVLTNTTPKQIIEDIGPTGSGGASRSGANLILTRYLEGAPGHGRIRANAKEAPTLPEVGIKEEILPHEIWTEETAAFGRVPLSAIPVAVTRPSVPKASRKRHADGPIEDISDAVSFDGDGFVEVDMNSDPDPIDLVSEPVLAGGDEEEEWEFAGSE